MGSNSGVSGLTPLKIKSKHTTVPGQLKFDKLILARDNIGDASQLDDSVGCSKAKVDFTISLTSACSSDLRQRSNEIHGSTLTGFESPRHLEIARDTDSPRFQALLQLTTGLRKTKLRSHNKSFSELEPKDLDSNVYWRPHSVNDLEEILRALRAKFNLAKQEVNAELAAFESELNEILQTCNASSEWKERLEELLFVCRECSLMTPLQFQQQCETVVQALYGKRQELTVDVLKQLYTRMLFILTRCTRLLQFQNENGLNKDVCLNRLPRHPESDPAANEKDSNVYSCPATVELFKQPSWAAEAELTKELDVGGCQTNLGSLPLLSEKNKAKQADVAKDATRDAKALNVETSHLQQTDSEHSRLVCRICELGVPASLLEGHSRVCAIADRCDHEGLCLDDRLNRLAETLERIVEAHSPKGPQTEAECSSDTGSAFIYSKSSESMFPKWCGNDLPVEDISEDPNMSGVGSLSYKTCLPPGQVVTASSTGCAPFSLMERSNKEAVGDLVQIEEMAHIAQCAARISIVEETALEHLNLSFRKLERLLQDCEAEGLTANTYGGRIKALVREKYLHACKLGDHTRANNSSKEDGPSQRTTATSLACKNRTSIEDFEIIKPISRGAFGRVFLARKKTTGDLFAIKVLRKADMIRKNAVRSVQAERNILISARNPFVVRFFYSFTCNENLYLVMEYLNGGDLYSLLMNLGCLEEDMARVYIAELVLALEYLHSLGVVHRDLKPDNILIAHDGHIKLTDFGLSRMGLINRTDDLAASSLLNYDKEHHQPRSAVGTPDYLAPEILLGTGHDHAADWWSVGIILFEFLTGVPPFNAEHPQVIFDNILNRKISWPRVPEEISYEAYDLINKLLMDDPKQRLGFMGAKEVKAHPFFKDIKWDMLAKQKAAFVPCPDDHHDTSYFNSRRRCSSMDSIEEGSSNTSTCSMDFYDNGFEEEEDDDCHELAEFGSSSNITFSNFSFKNLSQLASINYDLLMQNTMEPFKG